MGKGPGQNVTPLGIAEAAHNTRIPYCSSNATKLTCNPRVRPRDAEYFRIEEDPNRQVSVFHLRKSLRPGLHVMTECPCLLFNIFLLAVLAYLRSAAKRLAARGTGR